MMMKKKDEEENPEDQVPRCLSVDYTSTKEKGYFTNRKSWCKMKDQDDEDE